MAALIRIAALLAALAAVAAHAQRLTFTENDPCTNCVVLGYPVPLPVASLLPVDGFRDYGSLRQRLDGLALTSDFLDNPAIGTTTGGREIVAYVLGDADAVVADGTIPEPAALQNGGIHAREWQSPEVVAGIVERIVGNEDDAGLHRYLLDNLTLVLIPVLNVDGFLQTQRYPAHAQASEFPGEPNAVPGNANSRSPLGAWPRDGRMRRKNMRDVDESLDTLGDFMFGVDLNRNNTPFFASGFGSSSDTRSLVYRGTSAASEPEIQALQAAAALGPAARLRFYVDTHSFTRAFLAVHTGNARRDALQDRLADLMRVVPPVDYCYRTLGPGRECDGNPGAPGRGIGTTDEHFAYTYQIPSWTLELEPGFAGAREYGGNGYHHDGFILPDSEIARVRDEMADAMVIGYYRQAGPPALVAADLRTDTGAPVAAFARAPVSATSRDLSSSVDPDALVAGQSYVLWLAFDKPMRVRNVSGDVINYTAQAVPLAPVIRLEGLDAGGRAFSLTLPAPVSGWRNAAGGAPDGYRRYADDAYATSFTIPSGLPLAGARRVNLRVEVEDASGQALDADPSTVVDWSGGAWDGYEDRFGRELDAGGPDRTLRVVDDGGPVFDPLPRRAGGGGLGAGLLVLVALAALRAYARAGPAPSSPSRKATTLAPSTSRL